MGRDNLSANNCIASAEFKCQFRDVSLETIEYSDRLQPSLWDDINVTNFSSLAAAIPARKPTSWDPDELDDAAVQELFSFDDDNSVLSFESEDSNNDRKLKSETPPMLDTLELDLFSTAAGLPDYLRSKKAMKTSGSCGVGKNHQKAKTQFEMLRDRRRKDEHNRIERRRRYRINDKIKELATLLPKTLREQIKLNKGAILKATVDYLRLLNQNQLRIRRIVEQSQKLKSENETLWKRIQDMENLLKTHDVSAVNIDAPRQLVNPAAQGKRSIAAESLHTYAAKPAELKDSGPPCKISRFSLDLDFSAVQPCASTNIIMPYEECLDTESFVASINIQSGFSPFSNSETEQFSFDFVDMFLK